MRLRGWTAAVALASAAPALAASQADLIAALQALTAKDLRVATVGERLARAALPWCGARTARSGLLVQDASQFRGDVRPAAIALYGLQQGPAISGVVPGSAADRAGLRAGDQLVALNGQPLAYREGDRHAASEDAITALIDRLNGAFAAGRVRLDVRRDGRPLTVTVAGETGCATDFQMDLVGKVNAGADGKTVTLSQGVVDFTAGDDAALAFVLAHELSHNILGHRRAIDAARARRGLLGRLGSSGGTVLRTEMEADYHAVYIVAAAGYAIDGIPEFWRRVAKRKFLVIGDGSHLSDGSRIRFLQRVVAEVAAARAAGRLAPDYAAFVAKG